MAAIIHGMSRRQWARAAYRLSRAIGNDRLLSVALAWQGYKYGPEAAALLAMTEEQDERLVIGQDYIDSQREQANAQ